MKMKNELVNRIESNQDPKWHHPFVYTGCVLTSRPLFWASMEFKERSPNSCGDCFQLRRLKFFIHNIAVILLAPTVFHVHTFPEHDPKVNGGMVLCLHDDSIHVNCCW